MAFCVLIFKFESQTHIPDLIIIIMGNVCCIRRSPKRKISLLLVGLDNAGKTVAAKNLAGEDISCENVMPTIGFSILHLQYKGCDVDLFDLGGNTNIRGIWDKYFAYAHGVMFVVDSSDYERISEAKSVLYSLVSHEKIAGKPLVILANKQDNEDAMDEIDLIEKLQLEALVNKRQSPTLVESCAAAERSNKSKLDPGIQKAYHWLLNYIIRDYNNLNNRVEEDVKIQEFKDHEVRSKIINRIKLQQENESNDEDRIELYSEYDKKVNGVVRQDSVASEDIATQESTSHKPQIEQRPKSAVQIVKEQLELNQIKQRSPLKFRISKRTEPINLYGPKLPHSADIHNRSDSLVQSRHLRSAGDSVFIVSNGSRTIGNLTEHGDTSELFQVKLNNKLPPIELQKMENIRISSADNDENPIRIVELD